MWIRKAARHFVAVINQVSKVAGIIGIVFLLAMVVLTALDVSLRYFFNLPIPGSVELTQYFMVIAGFLGLAWCALKDGHVKVDLIVSRLSSRSQSIIDSITLFLSLTVIPLVSWQGFMQARYTLLQKSASAILGVPAYPFYLVVGFGFAILFFVSVILLVKSIMKIIQKR